jgi:PAS domain S-box-containing protein
MATQTTYPLSFKLLAENAPDLIFRYRLAPPVGFEFVNEACEHITGYTREEYVSDPGLGNKTLLSEDLPIWESLLGEPILPTKKEVLRHRHKNGHVIWLETVIVPVLDDLGRLESIECIAKDISKQVHLERRLNDALQEKELLFRELQHRIKNTFMMISGLFSLEMEKHNEAGARAALRSMQERVNSMSYLYSMLRAGDATSMVSLNAYIYKLIESLMPGGHIKTDLQLESVEVNSRIVMPIGLILNEMITNSIKYAFPDGRDGCVSVELTRSDPNHIHLRMSDNGVGWPEGFNPEQSTGLGTQLVNMLSEQIGAVPMWNSENGLSLELRVPLG